MCFCFVGNAVNNNIYLKQLNNKQNNLCWWYTTIKFLMSFQKTQIFIDLFIFFLQLFKIN